MHILARSIRASLPGLSSVGQRRSPRAQVLLHVCEPRRSVSAGAHRPCVRRNAHGDEVIPCHAHLPLRLLPERLREGRKAGGIT